MATLRPMNHPHAQGTNAFIVPGVGADPIPVNRSRSSAPRYLIRNQDGKVFPWSPALAEDAMCFTPSNTLPDAHILDIQAANIRAAQDAAALNQATLDQKLREDAIKAKEDALLAKYAATSVIPTPQPVADQLRVDEAILLKLNQKQLYDYAKGEFDDEIAQTLTGRALQEHIRTLQAARRDATAAEQLSNPAEDSRAD